MLIQSDGAMTTCGDCVYLFLGLLDDVSTATQALLSAPGTYSHQWRGVALLAPNIVPKPIIM